MRSLAVPVLLLLLGVQVGATLRGRARAEAWTDRQKRVEDLMGLVVLLGGVSVALVWVHDDEFLLLALDYLGWWQIFAVKVVACVGGGRRCRVKEELMVT